MFGFSVFVFSDKVQNKHKTVIVAEQTDQLTHDQIGNVRQQ